MPRKKRIVTGPELVGNYLFYKVRQGQVTPCDGCAAPAVYHLTTPATEDEWEGNWCQVCSIPVREAVLRTFPCTNEEEV